METPPAPEGSEIPDWLQDLRSSLPEGAVEEPGDVSEAQGPDWLAELGPSVQSAEPELEPTGEEEAEEGEIPDWLAELQPSAQAGKPEPEGEEEVEIGQVPDWLAELQPSAEAVRPESEPEGEEEAEEGEVPDWLAKLQPSAEVGRPESEPEGEEDQEELPDWLAQSRPSAPSMQPEPEPEGEEEAEKEEVPDWLAELQPSAEAGRPEPGPEGEEEEGIPDWLAELRPPAQAGRPEPKPEGEEEEEEVSDWLVEVRPPAVGREAKLEPEPEAEADVEEEELPDWLAELQAPAAEAERAPEPELGGEEEEEELPGWLTELQAPAPELEPESEAEPEAEGEEGELPGWLTELRSPEEADAAEPDVEAEQPQPEGPASEVPDWLGELEEPEEPEPAASEGVPEKGASMPDWLTGLRADLPPEPALPEEEELAEVEIPDWLVPFEMAGDEDALARAEIPAWLLELKPRELKTEEEEEPLAEEPSLAQPVEETGLLAGIQGTLPAEMLIAQPRAAAYRPPEPSPGDSTPARLFAEIVAQPTVVPASAPAEPPDHLLSRVVRWILAGALIAAVTIPLLLKDPLFTRSVEPTPAVEALYTTINSLEAGSPVLLAFDYDPTTSDEMNVIAQTIVGHLMDRGARVVAVSLLPAGAATAESLLEFLAAGRPYVNLGYLPGDVAAVRLLGQSFETAQVRDYQGTPVGDLRMMDGITSIQDFDLLIDLTGAQNSLRWWIEQLGTPYGIPMAAGVSAAIDPIALSYFETPSRQLIGVVGGVPDAATYEALVSGQEILEGPLAVRLDAQLVGHGVLVLVLLVGNVVFLVQRETGRNR